MEKSDSEFVDACAIAVLTGLVSHQQLTPAVGAKKAYEFAEAMLKARGEYLEKTNRDPELLTEPIA